MQLLFRYLLIVTMTFILVMMMYPRTLYFNSASVEPFLSTIHSPTNFTIFRTQEKFNELFSDIKIRIQRDNTNIKSMCPPYLHQEHKLNDQEAINLILKRYHINNEKKLGWCFNAKVSIAC